MKTISCLCMFCFLLTSNSVITVSAGERGAVDSKTSRREANKKNWNKGPLEIAKLSLQWKTGKEIQTLDEAEKYLERLMMLRNILVGDFFEINQTAHRYAMVFDRLGYIRYRISQIDKEIKAAKQKIAELKRKTK